MEMFLYIREYEHPIPMLNIQVIHELPVLILAPRNIVTKYPVEGFFFFALQEGGGGDGGEEAGDLLDEED